MYSLHWYSADRERRDHCDWREHRGRGKIESLSVSCIFFFKTNTEVGQSKCLPCSQGFAHDNILVSSYTLDLIHFTTFTYALSLHSTCYEVLL